MRPTWISRSVTGMAVLTAVGLFFQVAPPTILAAGAEDARAAIDTLHQQDVSATLAGDPKGLAALFTDDAVLLEPGSSAVVGRQAILAENEKEHAAHPDSKIVSYKPVIQDLQIRGDWAYEWDTFDASYKESADAEAKSFRAKALRILHRQPDGSWKFSHAMWNTAEGQ